MKKRLRCSLNLFRQHSVGITTRNLLNSDNVSSTFDSCHKGSKKLTWYSCGPTVYEAAHIGHARAYICTDTIRRILEDYFGYEVNFAMGVTDIDDKIIQKAAKLGFSDWKDINNMVRQIEADFLRNMDEFNIRRPDASLRVSEHLPEIISYIEKIIANGRAYRTESGVYFDVAGSLSSYGKLGPIPPALEEVGGGETDKRDQRDFALWKAAKAGEPRWDSPWGRGRPGWHIECSAMVHSYFGAHVDIHSGGIDLRFPHHTNEIAQSEAYNCCDGWVRYWIHTGHLFIEGRKMSKSLKNFVTVDEYLSASLSAHPAEDFRIMCLNHKYHSAIHYSTRQIDEAVMFREKVENFSGLFRKLKEISSSGKLSIASKKPTTFSKTFESELEQAKQRVRQAFCDDFDTPTVLSAIATLSGKGSGYLSQVLAAGGCSEVWPIEPVFAAEAFISRILNILGLSRLASSGESLRNQTTTQCDTRKADIDLLVSFRSAVRKQALLANKILQKKKTEKKEIPSDLTKSTVLPGDLNSFQRLEDEVIFLRDAVQQASAANKEILRHCDQLRNEQLPALGVKVEDVGEISTWKSTN